MLCYYGLWFQVWGHPGIEGRRLRVCGMLVLKPWGFVFTVLGWRLWVQEPLNNKAILNIGASAFRIMGSNYPLDPKFELCEAYLELV